MFLSTLSKYRNIILAIGLFILLDVFVMGLTYLASYDLSQTSLAVSEAGRIRMLSQRLMKNLYQLNEAIESEDNANYALLELKNTYQKFDETLSYFELGGEVYQSNGKVTYLSPIEDKQSQERVREMRQVWSELQNLVNPVISVPAPILEPWFLESLDSATAYVKTNNLSLLSIAESLTTRLREVNDEEFYKLRIIEITGIAFAFINFFFIIYYFLNRLHISDLEMEETQQKNREILDFVQEGLLLLDQKFTISDQYSAFSEQIFLGDDLAGANFIELFKGKISTTETKSLKRFMKLLLDEKVQERLINDLNPLKNIRMSISSKDHGFETKHLSFTFKRTFVDGEFSHVLVTIEDITELEKLRAEAQAQGDSQSMQLSMLHNILQIPLPDFRSFIDDSVQRMHKVNAILQQPSRRQDQFEVQIHDIVAQLHKLKGESSMLGMHNIAQSVHKMESEALELLKVEDIKGDHFLPLTVMLKQLLQQLENFQAISVQLKKNQKSLQQQTEIPEELSIVSPRNLKNLVDGIAKNSDKLIQLNVSQSGKDKVSSKMRTAVKDIVIQLVRNSAVHGIERRADRGFKDMTGKIKVKITAKDDVLTLIVKDDGVGIDVDKLKAQAFRSGRFKTSEITKLTNEESVGLIFEPGLSTASDCNQDAGRGVGMLAIKQMVKNLNGKIAVAQSPGEFCQFSIRLPLAKRTTQAVTYNKNQVV